MSGARLLGVVISAGRAGFGYIGHAGVQFYAHISELAGNPGEFLVGRAVEFTPASTSRGRSARDVFPRPDLEPPPAGPRLEARVADVSPHGDYVVALAGGRRYLVHHTNVLGEDDWPLMRGDRITGEAVQMDRGGARLVLVRKLG